MKLWKSLRNKHWRCGAPPVAPSRERSVSLALASSVQSYIEIGGWQLLKSECPGEHRIGRPHTDCKNSWLFACSHLSTFPTTKCTLAHESNRTRRTALLRIQAGASSATEPRWCRVSLSSAEATTLSCSVGV